MSLQAFDENRYKPLPRHAGEYRRLVKRGFENMKEKSTVICGTARNVQAFMATTVARVEALGSMFGDYAVLVFENDSTDETLPLLKAWADANPRVVILTERRDDPVNPGTRCPDRATRMATYRNKYLDFIRENMSNYSHVAVADMDLPDGWSYEGAANTFGHVGWDFVGSNGIMYIAAPKKPVRCVHFDAWAFRQLGHPEPHKPQEVNPLQFVRGQPMLPMHSCFGGLGFYNMKAFLSSRYEGGDCEHVPFHTGMRNAGHGKIYMNPSQMVLYGTRNY